MITADRTVSDNQWWIELLQISVKTGDYFEILCWHDEKAEIRLARDYGEQACYSIPDMTIIHGTVSERLQTYLEHISKPKNSDGYNKMIPFYTLRIGNHFSSEKYGTEIILHSRSPKNEKQIMSALSRFKQGITVYGNK